MENIADCEPTNQQNDPLPPIADRQYWLRCVFDRYQRPLISYAMRLLSSNVDLSRDCVQDTFMSLCRQPIGEVENHVQAWLFTTCRNRAIDHYRRETTMLTKLQTVAHLQRQKSAADDPATIAESNDQHDRMRNEINRLSQREQEVLGLRLNEGLSYKQIATLTGMTTSHVGVTIHQAVQRLRVVLAT